ncbi:MAG TPA: rhomboid family intramembrane serine protease, partial [Rhodospirillaceae bacterium]|nr:rhomboid family intramembrane serine protease [Rhodospirillaceae bacterium]
MHLLLNGTMMLVMGLFTETMFGPRRMVFFFFVCGILGAAFYFAINPFSAAPVIGASGSISGLFAITLLLMHGRGMLGPVGRRGVWPMILLWVAVITI